jgi:hypothetical protein
MNGELNAYRILEEIQEDLDVGGRIIFSRILFETG